MGEIEAEFRVSCTEKDKEFALISYGPILQSSLSLSLKPMECKLFLRVVIVVVSE